MSHEDGSLIAIVVAAGSGRRFGGDKLFLSLDGRPVLAWSLRVLEETPEVSRVVLVLSPDNRDAGRRLVDHHHFLKVSSICIGGVRRQDSVRNGLAEASGATWVAVHDGARPFVTRDMIQRGLTLARRTGAAIAAVPVKDTVKIVGEANVIERTPPRNNLWCAQTPQIFRFETLANAYEAVGTADVTDDAELLERVGVPVGVFEGSYTNLKITTPDDLALARVHARALRSGRGRSA